ncbi:MAG: peptidase M3, partial [Polyangia bacterium]
MTKDQSPMAPDGARPLTQNPALFTDSCRADIAEAKNAIAKLKTLAAPLRLEEALSIYDEAVGALGDAAARASVCRNAHPEVAMRDAAETCEQEIDAAMTELSLDRGVY